MKVENQLHERKSDQEVFQALQNVAKSAWFNAYLNYCDIDDREERGFAVAREKWQVINGLLQTLSALNAENLENDEPIGFKLRAPTRREKQKYAVITRQSNGISHVDKPYLMLSFGIDRIFEVPIYDDDSGQQICAYWDGKWLSGGSYNTEPWCDFMFAILSKEWHN